MFIFLDSEGRFFVSHPLFLDYDNHVFNVSHILTLHMFNEDFMFHSCFVWSLRPLNNSCYFDIPQHTVYRIESK